MKTGKIEIAGKTYLTCLSAAVIVKLQEKGDIQSIMADLEKSQSLKDSLEMIYLLIEAGSRYAKLTGIDNPPLMSFDDMCDILGMDDLIAMNTAITETIEAAAPDIEIQVPNTEPSQEKS